MTPDLRPLRDIHDGLGSPWWPLAPGWWLAVLLFVALAALIWRYRRARIVLPVLPLLRLGDWRWDAHRELRRLRQPQQQASLKARLAQLAELLKRIAMARHGRIACAGLHGQAWLAWLSAHDPDGFDWHQHGQPLIYAPYAPETFRPASDGAASEREQEPQLERLIMATERWIMVRPKPGTERGQATARRR